MSRGLVTSQPSAISPAKTPMATAGQSVATDELGAIGRDSPFGKIPVNEKKSRRKPAQSQSPRRLARLRSAG